MLRFSFFALLVVCGCNKSVDAGSCAQKGENACVEYDAMHAAAGKRLCASSSWTSGAMSCTKDARVGICAKGSGAEKEVRFLYQGAPNNYDAASAKVACQASGGSFAAEPPP